MIQAFTRTLSLAVEQGYDRIDFDIQDVDFDHLQSMLDRIKADPTAFSDAKLGRWLGYAQGVLVANGCVTLDQMKAINLQYAD